MVDMIDPVAYQTKPDFCLYCPNRLPSGSGEHLFNSSWGGRHKSRWTICDECNAAFSSDVDTALLPAIRFVMNGFGIKGERQKAPPVIPTADGGTIEPYGLAKPAPDIRTVVTPDGGVIIEGTLLSEGAYKHVAQAFKQAQGRPPTADEKRRIKAQLRAAPVAEDRGRSVTIPVQLDLGKGYRSAVHTALKALSAYEPARARSADLEEARRFARYGEGEWEDFAVTLATLVDVASELMSGPEWPLTNALQLWFDAAGHQVLARLTVLGRVVRDVRLTNSYDGPNRTLFVFEPFDHRERLPAIEAEFKTPPHYAALDQPLVLVEAGPAPAPKELGQDLARTVGQSTGLDALSAALGNGIERVAHRYPEFGTDATREFGDVFADALARFSYLAGDPRSKEDALELIQSHGLDELASTYGGRQTEEEDVVTALGDLFHKALTEWTVRWRATP